MGTIAANALIAKAQTIIQDRQIPFSVNADDGIRWTTPEWLAWLNDGQRETVLYRPAAGAKTEPFTLVTGTKQSLDSLTGAVMFMKLTRNLTPTTTAVRECIQDALDSQRPDWHSETNTIGKVRNYMYDPKDPKVFYVYPQATNGWTVELVYSKTPDEVATVSNPISIDDIYANALVDYMLYRAYSKDATFAGNSQLAVAHYTAFQTSLAARTANEGK
jgi:hypothetical protein